MKLIINNKMSYKFIEVKIEPIRFESGIICGKKQVVKIFGIIVFFKESRFL